MTLRGLPISHVVLGAALRVHRQIGPGLYESVYERCLVHELEKLSVVVERQVPLTLVYESVQIPCAYRVDLIVDRELVVELKCVERLMPVHHAQTLTYLKLSGCKQALLLNFNTARLKDGIKSFLATADGSFKTEELSGEIA